MRADNNCASGSSFSRLTQHVDRSTEDPSKDRLRSTTAKQSTGTETAADKEFWDFQKKQELPLHPAIPNMDRVTPKTSKSGLINDFLLEQSHEPTTTMQGKNSWTVGFEERHHNATTKDSVYRLIDSLPPPKPKL
jgi:hypothetical protein